MTNYQTSVQENGSKPVEGRGTRAIEQQTAKIPSIGFLTLAVGAMGVSAAMMLADKKGVANFIGQWAPSLLVIGVYNKLVKIENELMQARGRV
jgi:hypothetical protein